MQDATRRLLFCQKVVLRALLCQCNGLQAKAQSQLGRTTDAEASQEKALSYVDPAADRHMQLTLVAFRDVHGELCFCSVAYKPALAVCRQAVSHI